MYKGQEYVLDLIAQMPVLADELAVHGKNVDICGIASSYEHVFCRHCKIALHALRTAVSKAQVASSISKYGGTHRHVPLRRAVRWICDLIKRRHRVASKIL